MTTGHNRAGPIADLDRGVAALAVFACLIATIGIGAITASVFTGIVAGACVLAAFAVALTMLLPQGR